MSKKSNYSQVLYKSKRRKFKVKKTKDFVYDSRGLKIYI